MRVKQILDVRLVIADIEVSLNGNIRGNPTLCAVVTKDGAEQVVPLNTPDGRPILMKLENAIPAA